jgi:putative redox protein
MEMVLLGTGGCTAYDVVLILRRAVRTCAAARSPSVRNVPRPIPKVFTRIHFEFTVRGRGLKPNVVERAIKLSHDKYCSASIMLGKTAELSTAFTIVDDLETPSTAA